jgi:transcriptional regulator with GAF, ATPase, and Fis domain
MDESCERERDFYRSLVELSVHEQPEPLLRRALSILVTLSGAREAYIELRGSGDESVLKWSASEGVDATRVDAIRAAVSQGIIAQAIATGEVIVTASALADPRFHHLGSVREHSIEAVLCAPIGGDQAIGVLYLQGRRGADAFVPFDEALREHVTLFARAFSPIARVMLQRLAKEQRHKRRGAFAGVVAESRAMTSLVEQLTLVAGLDVQVLLTGPSGAGKTYLAHALHAESKRRAKPFVELNCAAIPEALLENELFGADPGAHSAVPRRGVKGKVEAAEGGTLFLDEVGELSISAQAKLLQLLHDRSYYRLGSSTLLRADVRIVTATNVSLLEAVAQRRFRQDLYYRLSVFEARVPSLAERTDDILPLATHFCELAATRHRLPIAGLSPAALETIFALEWPGNVRELAHRVESAVLRAHLRRVERVEQRDILASETPEPAAEEQTLQDATRRFQARHVQRALEAVGWNVSEAAKRLDVARSHLYTLIRAFELAPPRGDTDR